MYGPPVVVVVRTKLPRISANTSSWAIIILLPLLDSAWNFATRRDARILTPASFLASNLNPFKSGLLLLFLLSPLSSSPSADSDGGDDEKRSAVADSFFVALLLLLFASTLPGHGSTAS